MTATRAKLAKVTDISSGKEGFISVSVTDREKKRAAEMANAYTAELRALTQSLAVTEASQRRLFFEQQLKKTKEAVVEAEVSFQQVQQKNGVVQLDAQTRTIIESLAALRRQIAAKEIELDALRSYSTDRNPSVQLAERELLTLKEEAARLEQKSHSSGAVNMGLKDVSSVSFDYLRAEHELRYRQTMFDLLVKQYDVAGLDESKQAAIVQILEPAIEPDRKSSPNRLLIILLSVLAGLFLGIAWTIVKWWKLTLQSMSTSL
jgi:tyrosine-protein kinase Etk/Wzc